MLEQINELMNSFDGAQDNFAQRADALYDAISLLSAELEELDWDEDFDKLQAHLAHKFPGVHWQIMSRMRQRREVERLTAGHPSGTPVVLEDAYVVLSSDYRPRQKWQNMEPQSEEEKGLTRAERRLLRRAARRRWQKDMAARAEARRQREAKRAAKGYMVWGWEDVEWRTRRSWYSERLGATITILEHYQTGKVKAHVQRHERRTSSGKAGLYVGTWSAARAYTLESEMKAMECLKSKVTEDQYKRYFCTGMLVERSKRSRLIYVFRRMRPLLVLREHSSSDQPGYARYEFLTALCIHPQGYYSGTWAGTMPPTDDVIAQLLLMRSDERMLWRKATQHPRNSDQADF